MGGLNYWLTQRRWKTLQDVSYTLSISNPQKKFFTCSINMVRNKFVNSTTSNVEFIGMVSYELTFINYFDTISQKMHVASYTPNPDDGIIDVYYKGNLVEQWKILGPLELLSFRTGFFGGQLRAIAALTFPLINTIKSEYFPILK